MAVVEGAPETVANHLVDQLSVAEPVSVAPVVHQIRSARHVLHAPGNNAFGVAGADCLGRERDRFQAAPADLVDGCRWNALGEAGANRGLPRGVLPQAGLEHIAHEHLIDGIDAGATERLLDGNRSEPGCRHVGEDAAKGADRGPHSADDDRFFHADHSTPSFHFASCQDARRGFV